MDITQNVCSFVVSIRKHQSENMKSDMFSQELKFGKIVLGDRVFCSVSFGFSIHYNGKNSRINNKLSKKTCRQVLSKFRIYYISLNSS